MGQAGMTDKKLKTKKRLLQQPVSFNNDMTVLTLPCQRNIRDGILSL